MRQPLDEYFLKIVEVVGSRGTCDRGKSGAVIVNDRHILSVGFVGAASGLPHCDEIGHEMEANSCVRTVHAEMNAIVAAARYGTAIKGSTIYSTMFPCRMCAKLIVNAGICRVVSDYDYHKSSESKKIFDLVGVEYKLIHNTNKQYDSEGTQREDKTSIQSPQG